MKWKLKKSNVNFYDFTDTKTILSEKNIHCEFIDGYHGDDVLYARMIRNLAKKDSYFSNFTNIEFLNSFIKNNQGMAQGISIYNRGKKEVDFLKIGCIKKALGDIFPKSKL